MNLLSQIKEVVNRLLPRASFARSVGVLAGGAAFAQALALLALPIITRLYSPEDFSVLAVYASILSIMGGVACLRLEIAIPLPEREEVAANLLALAMLISATTALFFLLGVWCFPDVIVDALGKKEIRHFLWMIPLGIWMASSYSALQFWATRKKRFAAIARTRIVQSSGSVVTQMLWARWISFGEFGLLLGQLISVGAGVFGLLRTAWRDDRDLFASINFNEMRRALLVYKNFPKYSAVEVLANNGAVQIPIIIISAVALGAEAGYLFLAMKAMAIPLGLIGSAVSQVYISRAPQEMREGKLGGFTLKTIAGLVKTGFGPLLVAGIVSPVAFPLIFGSEWTPAGEMVAWMTPWFILQFVSSPVSMALHVTNNQRVALRLQIAGLITRVGGVLLAAGFFKNYVFHIYAVTGFVFYAAYLMVIARVTQIAAKELLSEFFLFFRFFISWILVGLFFYFLIYFLF